MRAGAGHGENGEASVKLYIRYGKFPPSERSVNHITNRCEIGVSCFRIVDGEPFTQSAFKDRELHLSLAFETLKKRKPVYLLTGEEVGFGYDGEPLIRNVKIVEGRQ